MKPCQLPHSIRLGPVRRLTSLATALGVVLALCLSEPTQGEVIDDFEQGYRFWSNGGGADSHVEIIGGQLHLSPPPEGFLRTGYMRVYSVLDEETLTFSVDVISRGSAVWSAELLSHFSDTPVFSGCGYGFYRLAWELRVAKFWNGTGCWLANAAISAFDDAETLSLSLTRQDNSMLIVGTVTDRATGSVTGSVTFLDTPSIDPTFEFPDNGGPWPTQVRSVTCGTQGETAAARGVVFDNMSCSHPPTPQRLAIERSGDDATALAWEGESLLMEATSPQGPWGPCIAEVSNSGSRFAGQVPLLDSQRFFALGMGRYFVSRFDDLGTWHTAKAIRGATGANLGLWVSEGQARANGSYLGDQEFLLREGVTGIWWRDCVASVDLTDWTPDLQEGTAFGMVLRAKPQTGVWLIEEEGLPENRYIGLLTFNRPGSPEESVLAITGPGGELLQETTLPGVDPLKDYRLRFRAVGEQLKLELFDADDLANPIATCEVTDDRSPTGIEALFVKPSPTGKTLIVFDNFLFWGVFTPAEW